MASLAGADCNGGPGPDWPHYWASEQEQRYAHSPKLTGGRVGNLAGRAAVPGGAARARLAGVLVPGPDANYGLRHLVQKKERAVLVLTEGLWWPELRRRWVVSEG